MSRTLSLSLFLSLLLCAGAQAAEGTAADTRTVTASIDELAWMTGSWSGPIGDGVLEENWVAPGNGSIGALVRMTRDGSTGMVELIVIEQTGETLTLYLQQWDPGMTPRSERAQKMVLSAIGEQSVSFRATEASGLKGLTYSRPADDTFVVEVHTPDDREIQINLKAR
ncbi:MAG: DUF6265 family protein [Pseudomonadales bacterium]|nr:hypothetical protein [Pseudomonadales bacterium]